MADKDSTMLMEAIVDYIGWAKPVENTAGDPGAIRFTLRYTRILAD